MRIVLGLLFLLVLLMVTIIILLSLHRSPKKNRCLQKSGASMGFITPVTSASIQGSCPTVPACSNPTVDPNNPCGYPTLPSSYLVPQSACQHNTLPNKSAAVGEALLSQLKSTQPPKCGSGVECPKPLTPGTVIDPVYITFCPAVPATGEGTESFNIPDPMVIVAGVGAEVIGGKKVTYTQAYNTDGTPTTNPNSNYWKPLSQPYFFAVYNSDKTEIIYTTPVSPAGMIYHPIWGLLIYGSVQVSSESAVEPAIHVQDANLDFVKCLKRQNSPCNPGFFGKSTDQNPWVLVSNVDNKTCHYPYSVLNERGYFLPCATQFVTVFPPYPYYDGTNRTAPAFVTLGVSKDKKLEINVYATWLGPNGLPNALRPGTPDNPYVPLTPLDTEISEIIDIYEASDSKCIVTPVPYLYVMCLTTAGDTVVVRLTCDIRHPKNLSFVYWPNIVLDPTFPTFTVKGKVLDWAVMLASKITPTSTQVNLLLLSGDDSCTADKCENIFLTNVEGGDIHGMQTSFARSWAFPHTAICPTVRSNNLPFGFLVDDLLGVKGIWSNAPTVAWSPYFGNIDQPPYGPNFPNQAVYFIPTILFGYSTEDTKDMLAQPFQFYDISSPDGTLEYTTCGYGLGVSRDIREEILPYEVCPDLNNNLYTISDSKGCGHMGTISKNPVTCSRKDSNSFGSAGTITPNALLTFGTNATIEYGTSRLGGDPLPGGVTEMGIDPYTCMDLCLNTSGCTSWTAPVKENGKYYCHLMGSTVDAVPNATLASGEVGTFSPYCSYRLTNYPIPKEALSINNCPQKNTDQIMCTTLNPYAGVVDNGDCFIFRDSQMPNGIGIGRGLGSLCSSVTPNLCRATDLFWNIGKDDPFVPGSSQSVSENEESAYPQFFFVNLPDGRLMLSASIDYVSGDGSKTLIRWNGSKFVAVDWETGLNGLIQSGVSFGIAKLGTKSGDSVNEDPAHRVAIMYKDNTMTSAKMLTWVGSGSDNTQTLGLADLPATPTLEDGHGPMILLPQQLDTTTYYPAYWGLRANTRTTIRGFVHLPSPVFDSHLLPCSKPCLPSGLWPLSNAQIGIVVSKNPACGNQTSNLPYVYDIETQSVSRTNGIAWAYSSENQQRIRVYSGVYSKYEDAIQKYFGTEYLFIIGDDPTTSTRKVRKVKVSNINQAAFDWSTPESVPNGNLYSSFGTQCPKSSPIPYDGDCEKNSFCCGGTLQTTGSCGTMWDSCTTGSISCTDTPCIPFGGASNTLSQSIQCENDPRCAWFGSNPGQMFGAYGSTSPNGTPYTPDASSYLVNRYGDDDS